MLHLSEVHFLFIAEFESIACIGEGTYGELFLPIKKPTMIPLGSLVWTDMGQQENWIPCS